MLMQRRITVQRDPFAGGYCTAPATAEVYLSIDSENWVTGNNESFR